jgi:hypothetical protein
MKLRNKNKRVENTLLNYSSTKYNSLDSLMKNIYYVEDGDFREEAIATGEIIDLFISYEKFNEADRFFYDILSTDNKNSFERLIPVIYGLKRKYFVRLDVIRFLQNLFHNLILRGFEKERGFSKKLNTGGLYLKEFLDIRYKDKFKVEENKEWLEVYKSLIDNTIKSLYNVCKSILSLTNLDINTKKGYFESYLAELNKSLEYNETLNEYDLLESNSSELKSFKIELINEKRELLKNLKISLFFLILYYIDRNKLPKDYFETAYTLYRSGNLTQALNETINPLPLSDIEWLNYDSFKGGAQTIPWFNYDKYRLLIFFYNYLNNKEKETGIKSLTKENFTGTISNLEEEVKNMRKEFVSKYFDFDDKRFNNFKKIVLKDILKKKEEVKKLEDNYVIKSKIKNEYVEQFKKDCKDVWEGEQKKLSEVLEIKKEEVEDKKVLFFGQHTLFPKEWFLDSFDKNVGLDRTTGKDFGRDQSRSKYRKVLEEINLKFDKNTGDEEIKINDLYNDLSKIIEDGKKYYLFYTEKEIYNLPNIEWLRSGIFVASLKIKNSEIYFCYSSIKDILFFEKGSFTLKQYSNKDKEDLIIEIDENFTKDEIEKILKINKSIKTKEDVLKKVKIKVLEKFEVKKNKGYKLKRLII